MWNISALAVPLYIRVEVEVSPFTARRALEI